MSLKNTKIQSLLFPKDKFTIEQSREWVEKHHFLSSFGNKKEPHITDEYIRFRQKLPSKKLDTHFATIDLNRDGIKAIIEYRTDDFVARGHFKKKNEAV